MKLQPFMIERFFAKYEFNVPHLMCTSDCESMSVEDLLKFEPEAGERLHKLWLGYTESQGSPELREAISGIYDGTQAGQVLVHTGAEEAIYNFMQVALESGDEIVVHAPYYQSLGEVARSIGARVLEWKGSAENGWELDLDDLRRLISPRTKVVVLNAPHNPTGFLPSRVFVEELSRLSERHGFLVFSDEVYRGLEMEQGARLPAFCDLNERAISLGVLSKTYGLAGLRIGWVATRNAEILTKMAQFKDYTTICNSAPSELLATVAMRNAEELAARNRAIIAKNLDVLDAFFEEWKELFAWRRPKAGPIAFPSLLAKGESVHEFCVRVAEEGGVLLLPGTLYGSLGASSLRVGFGRLNLPEVAEKLGAFLQRTAS